MHDTNHYNVTAYLSYKLSILDFHVTLGPIRTRDVILTCEKINEF